MSSDNNETRQVQIAVADPTPLGLFGLSVVTFVASMQKLGVVSDVSWVIPWALSAVHLLNCSPPISIFATRIFLEHQSSAHSAFSGRA